MDPDGWDGGCNWLDTRVSNRQSTFYTLGAAGRWKTYPEVLTAAGVSWKVYQTNDSDQENNVLRYFKAYQSNPTLIANAFWTPALTDFPTRFAADCAADQLPRVSWILPNLVDSEHPPAAIEWGQDAIYQALQALTLNPAVWAKTLLFITYDENGGFFDHVPPLTPPPGTPGENLSGLQPATDAYTQSENGAFTDPIGLGFRVPMLVISPFSRNPLATSSSDNSGVAPLVSSDRFDHTSLLRFVEGWLPAKGFPAASVRIPDRTPGGGTGTPGLSAWRRAQVGDLTTALNLVGPSPAFSLASVPMPNRADPRVLAECTITGEPGNLVSGSLAPPTRNPNPQPPLPAQETFSGSVQRPSGPRFRQPASRRYRLPHSSSGSGRSRWRREHGGARAGGRSRQ